LNTEEGKERGEAKKFHHSNYVENKIQVCHDSYIGIFLKLWALYVLEEDHISSLKYSVAMLE
jgi:hypothetical protein